MAGLDFSSLKPVSTGSAAPPAAPSDLNLSDLRPAAEGVKPDPGLGNPAAHLAYGLVKSVPHAVEGGADIATNPFGIKELGTGDTPEVATGFDKFIQDKYGAPNTKKYPNGWPDAIRKKAWREYGEAGGFTGSAPSAKASDAIRAGLNAVHANPDELLPAPTTPAERIADVAGEAIPVAAEVALTGGASLPAALGDAAIMGGSAAAGQAASEAVPEDWKPLVNVGTSLLTNAAAIPTTQFLKFGVKKAGETYTGLPEKILGVPTGSKTLSERAATNYVRKAATDPTAMENALEAMPKSPIPGFKPNLYQATDDPGIGVLSGVIDRAYPEIYMARHDAQAQAWHDALANARPDAQPTVVADTIRQQHADLDALTDAQVQAAQQQVRQSLGDDADASVLAERTRAALQSANDVQKERLADMWKDLELDKSIVAVAGPIKRGVAEVYNDITPEMKSSLTPYEREVQDIVKAYGATIPLRNLIDLRSRVSEEMRNANLFTSPNHVAAGRLTRLRGSIENAIDDTVARRAADEQAAVEAGTMAPQDTLYARLLKEQKDWLDARKSQGRAAVESDGEGAGPTASSGPVAIPRPSGTEGQAGARLPGDTGSTGVPPQPVVEPQRLTPEAAARLRAATAATKSLRTREQAEPNPSILKRAGSTYDYSVSPNGAGSAMWSAGPKGGDAVRNVASLAENHPDVIEGLSNLAGDSLRHFAAGRELTPEIMAAWRAKYGPALTELERLNPAAARQFDTAAHAADALAEARVIRDQATASYAKSVLGKFLGAVDESEVVKRIGDVLGSTTAVRDIRGIMREIGHIPEAVDGLRASIMDVIAQRAESAIKETKAGNATMTADAFNRFIRKTDPALAEVLTPEQIDTLHGIAETMKQASKTVNIPGQAGTHQFKEAAARFKEQSPSERGSFFGNIVSRIVQTKAAGAIAGGAAAYLLSPQLMTVALGAMGGELLSMLHQAGISRVNDLVRKMIEDPEFARAMMRKVPVRPKIGTWVPLKRRLAELALVTAMPTDKRETKGAR